ncbi:hypothetical protein [Govanella unica]|uniref:Uncharacterized protein n=1 Tax=Govanella unica TaxID=2975056 RepID=A0A9X3TW73_9PROT|nr:hypothetical protein [Govania unica]MDA5192854.1 hypothetical protein [Govania unica]
METGNNNQDVSIKAVQAAICQEKDISPFLDEICKNPETLFEKLTALLEYTVNKRDVSNAQLILSYLNQYFHNCIETNRSAFLLPLSWQINKIEAYLVTYDWSFAFGFLAGPTFEDRPKKWPNFNGPYIDPIYKLCENSGILYKDYIMYDHVFFQVLKLHQSLILIESVIPTPHRLTNQISEDLENYLKLFADMLSEMEGDKEIHYQMVNSCIHKIKNFKEKVKVPSLYNLSLMTILRDAYENNDYSDLAEYLNAATPYPIEIFFCMLLSSPNPPNLLALNVWIAAYHHTRPNPEEFSGLINAMWSVCFPDTEYPFSRYPH